MSGSGRGILNSEEETKEVEDDGCKRMLAAIIDRAMLDACGIYELNNGCVDEYQEGAIRWLFFDYATSREWSFKWICECLGRRVERVRHGVFSGMEKKFKRDVGSISFDSECDVTWLAARWDHALRIISETPWGSRELAKRREMVEGERYAEGFGKAWIGEYQDEESERESREGKN